MKKIIFILDDYFPNLSAIGVCINNIVEEFSGGYEMIIIAKKNNNTQQNLNINGNLIRYVNTTDNYLRNMISEKLVTARGLWRLIFKMAKTFIRGYGYICAVFKKSNVKKKDIRAFLYELEKIDGEIHTIIPTCLPFESILAALAYKRKCNYKVNVVPFLFDKFSENKALHRSEYNRKKKFQAHLLLEKQMLDECDRILIVSSWEKHLQTYFSSYFNKVCVVEHPLLKRIVTTETKIYDQERINIVYTGALYKKIRSPLHALRFFSRLIEQDKRILLHFYINGDCLSIINSYCKKYPKNIINHGSVPTSFAKAAMVNADILLSIGNSDVTQLPSKIFEYISTGIPIVHYYSNQDDPVISILKDYNNSYCVGNEENSVRQGELNIRKLINNLDNKIDFKEVQEIYHKATPSFVANKIRELLSY